MGLMKKSIAKLSMLMAAMDPYLDEPITQRRVSGEKRTSKDAALRRFPSTDKLSIAKEERLLASGCSKWTDAEDPDSRLVLALNSKNAKRKLSAIGVVNPEPVQVI